MIPSKWALPLIASLIHSCASSSSGTGCLNNIAPTGYTISASGSFTAGVGSISGNVTIYRLGTGSFEAFLNSFSGPSSTGGLMVIVKDSSGKNVLDTSLLAICGNQAYTFSADDNDTFVQASIYKSSTAQDLNQATLSSS